jgi:hypothetical protein
MMNKGIIVAAIALAAGGCGSSSKSAAKPSSRSSSASSRTTTSTNAGTASGQALVRAYGGAKVKTKVVLASDFGLWVSGQAKANGVSTAPAQPLSPSQRKAAAAVVLAYAKQLVAKREIEPAAVAYLKAHGVS